MKIRALTLENVRKFGGRRVSIAGIGDGITVISEANEFGKSTFFDAIHAVVFEKHTGTSGEIQKLRPRAGGGVRITLDFELESGRYRVEKRFLAQKGATVTDLDRGTVIARDGEAEDWMAQHVAAAEQGPAGLLWVRQGVLGLEPLDGKKSEKDRLTEARRDLLSSVAGEIEQVTGGRTMDRILRRCQEDLDALATGARLSPKGAFKETEEARKALEAELAVLEQQCSDLAEALAERRRIEGELQRLDDPAEKARRESDLREARVAAQAAESHAQKIAAAKGELDLAAMRQGEAERQRRGLADAIVAAGTAAEGLAKAEALQAKAGAALDDLRAGEAGLTRALEQAVAATRALRAELTQAERAERVKRARDEAERLSKLLEEVRAHVAAAAEMRERIADNPATPRGLAVAEAAVAEVAALRGAIAASLPRLTVTYSGETRLMQAGQPLPGGVAIALEHGAEIEMPGIGRLHVDLPQGTDTEEAQRRLAMALAAEAEALAACGADTLAAARQRAQARQADEAAAKLAEQMQRSLAPVGVDALERELASFRETVKGASDAPVRPVEEIAAALEAAETQEAEARGRLASLAAQIGDAREAAAASASALAAARDAHDRAEAAAGPAEDRTARLAALAEVADRARAETATRQAALDRLAADAPDAATAAANLKRAETAFDNARRRREQLVERRADLSARIDTRAEEGVEERRDEVAGRLAAATERAARFQAEVDALVRLRDALETARAGAREAYFEPVQDELRPLLRILHEDAGIDWETDSIMPGALRRGGETEAFDTLSGGTQEQIAILTRLAFARLFARRGQHLPIILDDALVYSDDERIVKMFTALNRVAMEQQIIVFSCRQLAFAGLGGERPDIRMEEVG